MFAVRFVCDLCIPHHCHCGSAVDARGLHGFVCKRAQGRSARHYALKALVARSFASAGVPVTKEPIGLFHTDGKRPDGVTLVPWQSGKSWDVTVTCPLAESYIDRTALEAGAEAEMAATCKEAKYVDLGARYIFESIAVETLGVLTHQLLTSSMILEGGSPKTRAISILVQRFNAVLLHDSLQATNCTD